MDDHVQRWMDSLSPRTGEVYATTLRDWTRAMGSLDELLAASCDEAQALAQSYRDHMLSRGLERTTVNHRLAVLRSMTAHLHGQGVLDWTLSVGGIRNRCKAPLQGFAGETGEQGCEP